MRVSQEKREPYTVQFVSANKHAIVLSSLYRKFYTMLKKISQIHMFAYFLEFSENMLNFWRGVGICLCSM